MKKISLILAFILLSFIAFSGQSTKNVAKVKLKRGIASLVAPDGTKAEIKRGMWIKEGSIIKTGDKSFVRLSFIDKPVARRRSSLTNYFRDSEPIKDGSKSVSR